MNRYVRPLRQLTAICMTLFLGLGQIGCSTSQEDSDRATASTARREAYAADGFMGEPSAPYHDPAKKNNMPFYHQTCSPTGGGSYFSKSSYFCDMR